jgi:hypothetical protein
MWDVWWKKMNNMSFIRVPIVQFLCLLNDRTRIRETPSVLLSMLVTFILGPDSDELEHVDIFLTIANLGIRRYINDIMGLSTLEIPLKKVRSH